MAVHGQCSECVNIIDGKLSFPLNKFVVFKDYVEHVFHDHEANLFYPLKPPTNRRIIQIIKNKSTASARGVEPVDEACLQH